MALIPALSEAEAGGSQPAQVPFPAPISWMTVILNPSSKGNNRHIRDAHMWANIHAHITK